MGAMTSLLYRLGRACVLHRRLVLLGWIVAAVGIIAIGSAAGGSMTNGLEIPNTDAQRAVDVLEQRFPSVAGTSAQVVFAVDSGSLADPAAAATVEAAVADIAAHPDVTGVGELQTSPNGRIAYVDVQYDRPVGEIRDEAFAGLEATAQQASANGVRVELGGELPSEAVDEPPGGQEIFGLVAAIIVLLLAFGSVIAMGLPIGTALLGLLTSLGLITLLSAFVDVNSVAPVLAAMIGLG